MTRISGSIISYIVNDFSFALDISLWFLGGSFVTILLASGQVLVGLFSLLYAQPLLRELERWYRIPAHSFYSKSLAGQGRQVFRYSRSFIEIG